MIGRLRKYRAYPYVVVGLTVLVLLVLTVQLSSLAGAYEYLSPGTDDFIEYWTAGQLLRNGESPYDHERLYALQIELGSPYRDPIIMWNPPWLLIWIYPLLVMPFLTSAQVWLGVNAALILLSATLIWRSLSRSNPSPPLGIAWVAAILFIPALQTLRMGQMSSIILLGVAGFLYFASRERSVLAGMFLALTSIKPHVVYLVWLAAAWWVLWQRRWGFVLGVLITLVPSLLLLTIVWPDWPAGYRAAMRKPPLYWETATLGGILRELVFTENEQAQFLPPLVGIAGFGLYVLWRRPNLVWQDCLGPILLVSVPTAAYGWGFDQVVLLVPYLQLVLWLFDKERLTSPAKAVVVAALVLIECGIAAVYMLAIPAQYLFWVPLALAAVYIYALLQTDRGASFIQRSPSS